MVGIGEVLVGGVFAVVGVWALHRLSVVANAALALRGVPTNDTTRLTDGQPVAVEGPVFVEEPAPVADRLFGPDTETVGAYVWHAWFPDTGRYTYDFDRDEHRQGRSTFASGLETGRVGVTADDQPLSIDLSWLQRLHDGDTLSELEVGDPVSNTKLPTVVTRRLWDSLYVSLGSTVGDCSMDRLVDVVDLYRDDVVTDEFGVESRGIAAGQQLFVYGELRADDGEYTVTGTDETPLLLSDTGRDGFTRHLRRRAINYVLALLAAIGLGALFVL
jgi:hypothetical protein